MGSEPKRVGMCEKCWGAAYGGGDQVDRYRELLEERKDNPCTLREHAGQWWDDERQCDGRLPDTERETPDV